MLSRTLAFDEVSLLDNAVTERLNAPTLSPPRDMVVGGASAIPRRSRQSGDHTVSVRPAALVQRQGMSWEGACYEVVETAPRQRTEYHYRAPRDLLIARVRDVRSVGEIYVEGLSQSDMHNLTGKLTFVPAGHSYHEWQESQAATRRIHVYLDPAEDQARPAVPRLLFDSDFLWETLFKLVRVNRTDGLDHRGYLAAVALVLRFELAQIDNTNLSADRFQGGLAAWQKRVVTTFIEEHLRDHIALADLAHLARLSPYHFARAFKQSFGLPPHRFHMLRRVERAKELLHAQSMSVSAIALALGFTDTSAFSTTFRKATGVSPTRYVRRLHAPPAPIA